MFPAASSTSRPRRGSSLSASLPPSPLLLLLLLSVLAALCISGTCAQSTDSNTLVSSSGSSTPPLSSGTTPSGSSPLPSTTSDALSTPSTSITAVGSAAPSTTAPTSASNYTVPSGATTATFPANFTYANSTPYEMTTVDIYTFASELPVAVYYSLTNETAGTRAAICQQQTSYCQLAGCAESGAVVKENFCNNVTMATRCSCSKGDSNLAYYHWPVSLADCTNRASACFTACSSSLVSTANRTSCQSECNSKLRVTCGTPGQIAVDYSTSSSTDKPSLSYVQGSTGGVATLNVKILVGAVAFLLLVGSFSII